MMIVVAVGVGQATKADAADPSPTAKQAKSLRLAKKVIKSKNPKKSYKALSKKDRGILDKEVKKGKSRRVIVTVRRFTPAVPQGQRPNRVPAAKPASVQLNCVEVEAYVVHNGGYSGWVLGKVSQVTVVCRQGNRIKSVAITDTWTEVNYLGWRAGDTKKQTKNTGDSGRSVVRQEWIFGAGGWDLVRSTDCVQVRVNVSLAVSLSMSCSL